MPSVQSAFGPIVEPGWPSTLPGQPDLIGAYQSAFQLHAAVNARRQEAEIELANHILRAKQAQYDNVMREKEFGLASKKVDLDYGAKIRGYEMREERLTKNWEDKERDDKWRERKYNDIMSAKDALLGLDDAVGKSPGEEGYPEEFDAAARSVRDKLSLLPNQVFNSMRNKKMKSHNENAASAWSQFHQDEKSLSEDISKSAFAGKLETNYGSILDYNLLEPETKGTGLRGWFGWGTENKPTGKLLVPQPGGGTLPVAVSELQRLKKRIQDVEARRLHLPYTVHIPEVGVYDEGKEPAPNDARMRRQNSVYITPDGKPHRWIHVTPNPPYGQWADP
jgi:hypothetical protein